MRIAYDRCPLCAGTGFSLLRKADCAGHPLYHPALGATLVWMACACGHVFTESHWSAKADSLIAQKTLPGQRFGSGNIELDRAVSARMIEKVLPLHSAGAWLDFGFGNGALMMTAREYGFDVTGIERRPENLDAAAAAGYRVRPQLPGSGSYQVISLCDALEHVPQPLALLGALHGLLARPGVLLLSMPNSDCAVWGAWGDQNPYWGELEHFHNFSRATLYRALEQSGFRPMRYGISERYRACMEVIAWKS
jgi:SAM-dependent methyltransferase